MGKNQLGFSYVIVAAVIIIAVGAGAGYFWYQNQSATNDTDTTSSVTPTPSPTASPEPQTDWATYTDKKGKYSVKYPSTWFKDTCDPIDGDVTLSLGPTKNSRVLCNSEHFAQISIIATSSVPTDSEQELDREYFTGQTSEQVTVDGKAGKRISGKVNRDDFGLPRGTLFVQYFFITPGKSYVAAYIQAPSGDYSGDYLDDFDNIIRETLKFK